MKPAGGVQDGRAPGVSASELEHGLDSFASGGIEESLGEAAAGGLAKACGEFPGQVRYVALEHCRTVAVELMFERGDHVRMIVAYVVDAIAGNKIQNPAPFGGVKFGTHTARIFDVHLQHIEQPRPLGIHIFFVQRFVIRDALCFPRRVFPPFRSPFDSVHWTDVQD